MKDVLELEGNLKKLRERNGSSLGLCNSSRCNWREMRTEILVSTGLARKEIVWWKIGFRRLNWVRRDNEQEICLIFFKEEDWSHVLRYERITNWRDGILDGICYERRRGNMYSQDSTTKEKRNMRENRYGVLCKPVWKVFHRRTQLAASATTHLPGARL